MATNHLHPHFDYISSDLSLDFTNTVSGWRELTVDGDLLGSYDKLVYWGLGSNILNQTQADALLAEAQRSPEQAGEVLERALSLREAIYRIFAYHLENRIPEQADLDILNRELAAASSQIRLVPGDGSFRYEFDLDVNELEVILYPVARSAADLLVSDTLDRVKQCDGDSCGWLFIDRSKNRSRRWCDMKDCGNEAKVRRFRQKQKAS